ncbi:MAG: 50S ribosomal protein L30 [Candidatus Cloacimonadota bacterium]|nr:50S ribosomal protein L30 [Candidatus Cloacimonadota bacterium]
MKLKITQIKSQIGQKLNQKETLKALGIRKMNQTVIHKDIPEIRGMINTVSHLVKVEKIKR